MRILVVSGTVLLALLLGLSALWMADRQWIGYEHEKTPVPQTGVRPIDSNTRTPLPLPAIIERLELPASTRILEIEREHRSEIMHYDIELVTDKGKIYKLHVDPYTAEIVKREEEP